MSPVAAGFVPCLHVGGTFATGSDSGLASTGPAAAAGAGAPPDVDAAAGAGGGLPAQAATREAARRGKLVRARSFVMVPALGTTGVESVASGSKSERPRRSNREHRIVK